MSVQLGTYALRHEDLVGAQLVKDARHLEAHLVRALGIPLDQFPECMLCRPECTHGRRRNEREGAGLRKREGPASGSRSGPGSGHRTVPYRPSAHPLVRRLSITIITIQNLPFVRVIAFECQLLLGDFDGVLHVESRGEHLGEASQSHQVVDVRVD